MQCAQTLGRVGVFLFVGLGGIWLHSGCALFGGGEVELKRAIGYRVSPPSNWKKTDKEESDMAFRLQSKALVTLTSSCSLHAKAPLIVLTRNLLMGTRDRKFQSQRQITVDGGKGLLSLGTATLEKKRFYFEIFVLSHRGCIFDFSLMSPKKILSEDSNAFNAFFTSLRYGEG